MQYLRTSHFPDSGGLNRVLVPNENRLPRLKDFGNALFAVQYPFLDIFFTQSVMRRHVETVVFFIIYKDAGALYFEQPHHTGADESYFLRSRLDLMAFSSSHTTVQSLCLVVFLELVGEPAPSQIQALQG